MKNTLRYWFVMIQTLARTLTVGPLEGFLVGFGVSICVSGLIRTLIEVGQVIALTSSTLLGARSRSSLISTNPELRSEWNY